MGRPVTTLFMLMSVDGKISTGATDDLDFDRDLPRVEGVREGLRQYYDIEQTTDLWSLNSGRVQAKLGVNRRAAPAKTPVSFVLLDDHHLEETGVRYFCARAKELVIATTNREHPAFRVNEPNLHIVYQNQSDLPELLERLRGDFGCERLTVQTGGTLNGLLLREKLLDYVDIVVAPVLVGGKETSTLIDGTALTGADELSGLGVLRLEGVHQLRDSYLRLRYQVIS